MNFVYGIIFFFFLKTNNGHLIENVAYLGWNFLKNVFAFAEVILFEHNFRVWAWGMDAKVKD